MSSTNAWSTQLTELLTAIPQLTIPLVGGNIQVCWPGTAVPFEFQATDILSSPNWMPISQGFSSSNGQVCALPPATGATRFFRLHQLP